MPLAPNSTPLSGRTCKSDIAKTKKTLSNTLTARDAELGRLKSVLKEREAEVDDLRGEVNKLTYCYN